MVIEKPRVSRVWQSCSFSVMCLLQSQFFYKSCFSLNVCKILNIMNLQFKQFKILVLLFKISKCLRLTKTTLVLPSCKVLHLSFTSLFSISVQVVPTSRSRHNSQNILLLGLLEKRYPKYSNYMHMLIQKYILST